jgi:rhodanese-related sulfurtransferase
MPVPRISKEELKRRLDTSPDLRPVLLDVRLKYPYEHSTLTLPGALRMPPGELDRSRLPQDREIVAYDSDPDELVAERVADELIRIGYRASALAGGVGAWIAAKFPTDPKPAPQTAPPAPGSLKSRG